jgi:hypothetical protein
LTANIDASAIVYTTRTTGQFTALVFGSANDKDLWGGVIQAKFRF